MCEYTIYSLADVCQILQSSIVVTGVPTKSYRLPSAWIKENTTVVNVASFKNVDEDEILQIPGVSKFLETASPSRKELSIH